MAKDPQLVETARAPAVESSVWGAVYLDAAEFAEFEKCIQTPQKPTESIFQAAEMIRELYGKNRLGSDTGPYATYQEAEEFITAIKVSS